MKLQPACNLGIIGIIVDVRNKTNAEKREREKTTATTTTVTHVHA